MVPGTFTASLSEEPSEQSFALSSLFVFFLIQFLFADLRYFDDRISVEIHIEHVEESQPMFICNLLVTTRILPVFLFVSGTQM